MTSTQNPFEGEITFHVTLDAPKGKKDIAPMDYRLYSRIRPDSIKLFIKGDSILGKEYNSELSNNEIFNTSEKTYLINYTTSIVKEVVYPENKTYVENLQYLTSENPLKLIKKLKINNSEVTHYQSENKQKTFYYKKLNITLGTGNGLISSDKGVAQQIIVYLQKYTLKYELASIKYKQVDRDVFNIPEYFLKEKFYPPKL